MGTSQRRGRRLTAATCAAVLLLAQPSRAIFGIGDIVHDPIAYADMALEHAEEAMRWTDTLQQYQQQVAEWKNRLDEFEQMAQKLNCVEDGARTAIDSVGDVEGIGAGIESTYKFADVGSCLTDGNMRAQLREAVRERLNRQKELDKAIVEIDGDNAAVKDVLNEMGERWEQVDDRHRNHSDAQRQIIMITDAEVRARARDRHTQSMMKTSAEMSTRGDQMRRVAASKINTTEGMMEALHLMLEFDNVMSSQMTAVTVSLDAQTELLRSMHEIMVHQMELARANIAYTGAQTSGGQSNSGAEDGAAPMHNVSVTFQSDNSEDADDAD